MAKARTTSREALGQQHHTRAFAVSMAASAAIHACALLAFSAMPLRDVPQVEPLQVTLDRTEPLRVLEARPELPSARPAAPLKAERLRKQEPARTADAPRPAAAPLSTQTEASPPAVLTTPTPPSTSEPAFTAAVAEPRSEAAAAPSRGEPSTAKTEPPAADKTAAVATLSVDARYVYSPKPAYPKSARSRGEEGTVILRIFVTRTGLPESISVHKTSGHRSLDEAAVEAVKTWRFAPARQGSQAVDSWVLVPVVFKLTGAS